MGKFAVQFVLGTSAMLLVSAATVEAAELRLRNEWQRGGDLVLLGDVAEVYAGSAEQATELASIELFPAPPAGEKRYLRVRELQDLLALRGVNLAQCRFTGSSQVLLEAAPPIAATATKVSALSYGEKRSLNESIRNLIVQYLRARVPQRRNWDVEIELADSQMRALLARPGQMSISGGVEPYVGQQHFTLQCNTPEGTESYAIDARITVPAVAVVAIRTLARGSIVHASDLQLQDSDPHGAKQETFGRLEDVVGQEVKRSIGAGQVITKDDIRAPLLVRNNDPVTVYSRSPGIQVRTTARACQDGSLGDLIAVESFADRRRFFARVSGVQEVELFARAASAESVKPVPLEEKQDAVATGRISRGL